MHTLIVQIQADGRRFSFDGRSAHGAALVVAFRDWLRTLPAAMAVGADALELETVWSGAQERAGKAPGLSSPLAGSTAEASIRGIALQQGREDS
jgi:hypothetical protein